MYLSFLLTNMIKALLSLDPPVLFCIFTESVIYTKLNKSFVFNLYKVMKLQPFSTILFILTMIKVKMPRGQPSIDYIPSGCGDNLFHLLRVLFKGE